jgi:putative peptidoglycan lipid II flippase
MSSGEGSTERVQFSSGGRIPRALRGRSGRATVPDVQAGSAAVSGAPLPLPGQEAMQVTGQGARQAAEQATMPGTEVPGTEKEPQLATLPATGQEPQPRSEFDAAGAGGGAGAGDPGTAGQETEPEPGKGTGRSKLATGIARGALIIAVLTTFSRVLGLLRTVVFAQTVGSGCLGTAYVTANQVPNLIYELAIGGALTSAMVPVLARSAARSSDDPDAKQHVERVSAALITWSVIILLPLTVVIAVAARPIAGLLNPVNPNAACPRADMIDVTANMLVVFAPQILLYGFSVMLFGLLQAYRKFTAYSMAPVVANVVMITSYLIFAELDHNAPLARTPLTAELVLAIGTTMNIGMLVIVSLPSVWRLRLRLRPTLRFPAGVLRRAGGLALVGLLEFVAGDIYSVATIALANGHGDTGALVLFNYESLVFTSVCSVLPIAIVTSAFPVLSAADGSAFDRTSAGSTRAVMLMSWLGTAVIAAVAVPAAHILTDDSDQVTQLAQAFLLCAPGVAGLALITSQSRVLFALGKLKAAGIGLVAAPLLQAVLSVPLVYLAPPHLVVGALSLAGTIGMLAVAIPMVIVTGRLRGRAAVAGVGHAAAAGIAASAAGAAAGMAVTLIAPDGGKIAQAADGALAAALAVLVFGLVAYALDRGDLRAVAGRARRLARRLR